MEKLLKLLASIVTIFTYVNCKFLDTDDEKQHNQVIKGCPPLLNEVDLSLPLLLVHNPILFLRQAVAIMCSSDNPN